MQNVRFMKMDVTTPLVVSIKVYNTIIDDIKMLHHLRIHQGLDEKEVASINVHRLYMKPGTKRIPLNVPEDGIYGRLFIPSGDGPFPGNEFKHFPT